MDKTSCSLNCCIEQFNRYRPSRRRFFLMWRELPCPASTMHPYWEPFMKSRVSWSYESNELLDVVESFLHNIATPCPQLCGRHTGGLHHPLSFAIWQRNAAALLIIVKLWNNTFFKCYSSYSIKLKQKAASILIVRIKTAFFFRFSLGTVLISYPHLHLSSFHWFWDHCHNYSVTDSFRKLLE